VDYARRPYTTKVKFFRDSSREDLLSYYPALHDAKNLPFPTAFVCQEWEKEPWTIEGVGERWLEPTPYNRMRMNPAALSRHICGTADEFLNGVVWDPSRPPTEYDNSGLPTCCGGPIGVVGISYGGTALVYVRPQDKSSGGISYGGTAVVGPPVPPVVGSGGEAYGGEALVYVVPLEVGSGGEAYGGEALVYVMPLEVGSGGEAYGGEADIAIVGPGSTCLTAAELVNHVPYAWSIAAGQHQWFRFPIIVGPGTFSVTLTLTTAFGANWIVYSGVCGSLHLEGVFIGSGTNGFVATTFGADGAIEIVGTTGSNYTIRFDQP